jgi:hypothetical protein
MHDMVGQTMNIDGSKETQAPEKNPYNIANIIKPAGVLTPNHPKIKTPATKLKGIMTFNGPVLSAMRLGTTRPNMDAAFRIESFKEELRSNLITECTKKVTAPNRTQGFDQCPSTVRILQTPFQRERNKIV